LYFVPTFGTGGTERLVLDLCRQLDSRFDPEVCALTAGSFAAELRQAHRTLTVIGRTDPVARSNILAKILGAGRTIAQLRRLLADHAIDIVHTHHLGPLFLAAAALRPAARRVKWVHTEHIPPSTETAYSRTDLLLATFFLRAPDIVTGVSPAVSAYYRDAAHIPEERIVTILNGVDVHAFAAAATARTAKRSALGLGRGDIVVGTVGNLRRQKNHQSLLRAFARLPSAGRRAYLVLCGDGECRPELERLAAELGIADRVLFLGVRLDVPAIMAAFDVYCLPSHYEGMPLSIMEAWAAGKPVVATDVSGIRELVQHGRTGYLVPPDDSAKLAEGLSAVLQDHALAQTLRLEGQAAALARCGIQDMVNRYATLYLELSGRAAGGGPGAPCSGTRRRHHS
jgi:glycosyltransferase involved in cell wall biosynthesis